MLRIFAIGTLLFTAPILQAQSICQIQGGGTNSPYDGQIITTSGIVSAIFLGTGTLGGFFLEDPACDMEATTSNGVFVYAPFVSGLAVGQRVQVNAMVDEYNGLTELTNASVTQTGSTGVVIPTPVDLPIATLSTWERYEGMLLGFPATLVVTTTSDWVQYGEITLAPERTMTPTNSIDPNDAVASGTTTAGSGNAAAVSAQNDVNARNAILLDDGRTASYPSPLPLIGPEGTLRTGSTITDLVGVLTYGFGSYRLQPVGPATIQHAMRPAVPGVGGSLRAVSLNLLNYWTTLGQWGAANSGELVRQRTKLLAALEALDADVLALHELENNDVAWADLLDQLNSVVGAGTYAALEENAFGNGGTKSVIFYRTATLTPITSLYSISTSLFQRPHLTQGFQENTSGGRFLFSTAHLRSKLCDNAVGDNMDQGDGQGCYNALRRAQATALVDHWAGVRNSTGIEAQLMMGDLNSYTEEDPMDVLREAGTARLLAPEDYSYVYAGSFGALDHAWATAAMEVSTTGAEVWHINSDEPDAFDYADQNVARYQPNAFRCSDHDPVVVGFDGAQLPVGLTAIEQPGGVRFLHQGTTVQWMISSAATRSGGVELYDARGRLLRTMRSEAETTITENLASLPSGVYLWRLVLKSSPERIMTGRFVLP